MIGRGMLRVASIAIAAAAVVDPTYTRELVKRQPLAIVATGPSAAPIARTFLHRVQGEFESTLRLSSAASRAAACPAAGACVLVSINDVPQRLTAGAIVIGGLRVPAPTDPVIAAIDISPRVHLNTSSVLHVRLNRGVRRIEVFDDDVLVGGASSVEGVDVPIRWTPVASGARKLRVVADGDRSDVGVLVGEQRASVLFYEPETTWLGTFVRRALEDDGRFELRGRTEVAPPVAITRGQATQLDARSLSGVDVVAVTAPHLLKAHHVDLLERFVIRRGGSLVLLADRLPIGPVLRLLPDVVEERRERQAQSLGQLRAADLLIFKAEPGVTVLERSDNRAVVVSRPIGRGRIIASGATDAWRYRDVSGAFETFWTGVMWEAAVAAGPPLRVTSPVIARPGEDVPITIETQSDEDFTEEVVAEGAVDCGGERSFLRLWPDARPGTFTALFRPEVEGRCRIAVSSAGLTGSTDVLISGDIQSSNRGGGRFDAAVTAHGGIVVDVGQEDELLSRIRERLPVRHEPTPAQPMRSPFWIVPLVACLGVELWMRRRAGLR